MEHFQTSFFRLRKNWYPIGLQSAVRRANLFRNRRLCREGSNFESLGLIPLQPSQLQFQRQVKIHNRINIRPNVMAGSEATIVLFGFVNGDETNSAPVPSLLT